MNLDDSVEQGLVAFQSGHLDEADLTFSNVLQRFPKHPQALHGKSLVLYQRGDREGACRALLEAIEVSPNVAGYHNNLGCILSEQGDVARAHSSFFRALKIDPIFYDTYESLGWLLCCLEGTGERIPLPRYLGQVSRLHEAGDTQAAAAGLQALAELKVSPTVDVLGHLMGRCVANWELCAALVGDAMPDVYSERALLEAILKSFRTQREDASALAVGKRLTSLFPDEAAYQFNCALLAQGAAASRQTVVGYLRRAIELDPQLYDARLMLAQLYKNAVSAWHFPMMNDLPRNEAFDAALKQVVKPGDLVLDIGAGSGLLSMMAARAGAAKVVACELVEDLALMAQEITAANGLGDKIDVVHAESQALRVGEGETLDRRADVLVAEIFDAGLLGEKAVATFNHARAKLLTPEATIIPGKATVYAALFESSQIREQLRVYNENACGFDLSLFNKLGIVHYAQMDVNRFEWKLLSKPVAVEHYDFHQDIPSTNKELSMTIDEGGRVDGVMFWFNLELAPGVNFSTDPHIEGTHWQQAIQISDIEKCVQAGDEAVLQVIANQLNYRGIRFEFKQSN